MRSRVSLSLFGDLLVVQLKHALKPPGPCTLRCDTLWHRPNALELDCAHMHVVVCQSRTMKLPPSVDREDLCRMHRRMDTVRNVRTFVPSSRGA